MLHSDHIDGTELKSYIKAHQIAYQIQQDITRSKIKKGQIKVLTKKEIICNNISNADAMVICYADIDLEAYVFSDSDGVSCTNEGNKLLLFDI